MNAIMAAVCGILVVFGALEMADVALEFRRQGKLGAVYIERKLEAIRVARERRW